MHDKPSRSTASSSPRPEWAGGCCGADRSDSLAVDEHLDRRGGNHGAGGQVGVADRAVGDVTRGDVTVGDGTLGDRTVRDGAVGDGTLGDLVAEIGDMTGILAAQAVVRVLARSRVPGAPRDGRHRAEAVGPEVVVAELVVAEAVGAEGPVAEAVVPGEG